MVGMLLGALLPLMAWVQSTDVAMALTFVLGLVGGFFVVPMNAMLQHRGAQLLTAGRSISVQNVNENANILLMMGIYSALLHAGISVVDVCWLLGAAVFLGMTVTRHGQPRVFASVLGVLVLGIMDNGLTQLQVDSYVREVLVGLIILLAVSISALGRKATGRR